MEYSEAKKECLKQGIRQKIKSRESMLIVLIRVDQKKASQVKREIEQLKKQICEMGG